MKEGVAQLLLCLIIGDDFERVIIAGNKFWPGQAKLLRLMGVELGAGGMLIGADVEYLAPFLLLDDRLDEADAIIQMDEVDGGVTSGQALFTSKKTPGLAVSAYQACHAQDSRLWLVQLPEEAFDFGQSPPGGRRWVEVVRLTHHALFVTIDASRAHKYQVLDRAALNSLQDSFDLQRVRFLHIRVLSPAWRDIYNQQIGIKKALLLRALHGFAHFD